MDKQKKTPTPLIHIALNLISSPQIIKQIKRISIKVAFGKLQLVHILIAMKSCWLWIELILYHFPHLPFPGFMDIIFPLPVLWWCTQVIIFIKLAHNKLSEKKYICDLHCNKSTMLNVGGGGAMMERAGISVFFLIRLLFCWCLRFIISCYVTFFCGVIVVHCQVVQYVM